MSLRLLYDCETRSTVSVADVGAWSYACCPGTEILCIGFAWKNGEQRYSEPHAVILQGGEHGVEAVEQLVIAAGGRIAPAQMLADLWAQADTRIASNYEFDRALVLAKLQGLAGRIKPGSRWSCIANRSRKTGGPSSLENIGLVMKLPYQKDMSGHRIMLQTSKPRKQWLDYGADGGRPWWDDAERLARNAIYCLSDIRAECAADDCLPELPENEYINMLKVMEENDRGIRIDVDLLRAMSEIVNEELRETEERINRYTQGLVPTLGSIQKIAAWAARYGVEMGNCTAENVEKLLAGYLPEPVRVILQARKEVSKSSTAKLAKFNAYLMRDNYVRGLQIAHGAHTGRTTGAGPQPLNMPRPYRGYEQSQAICAILTGRDATRAYGNTTGNSTLEVVAATMRGLFVPDPGKKFVVGDYSSVETAGLMFAAGQHDHCELLRNGGNSYINFGEFLYGRRLDKKLDLSEYTLCKATILGCGYGLGLPKYIDMCKDLGLEIPEDKLREAHGLYREKNDKVPKFWRGSEDAARHALEAPGKWYEYNGVRFVKQGTYLIILLPNGSTLYYPNCEMKKVDHDGREKWRIAYTGKMKNTKKWGTVYAWGGVFVENIIQKWCREIMIEHEIEWSDVVLTVYDELIGQAPIEDEGAVARMEKMLATPPPWCKGMPLRGEVHEMARYEKR